MDIPGRIDVVLYHGNHTVANASSDVTAAFGDATGLTGWLLFIAWTLVVLAVVTAARSNTHFQRLLDALGWVTTSAMYFLHGLAVLAGAAVLLAPGYFVATAGPSTQETVGTVVLGGLAVYAVVTGIGYVAKGRIIDPIRSNLSDALDELTDDEESDVAEQAEVSD